MLSTGVTLFSHLGVRGRIHAGEKSCHTCALYGSSRPPWHALAQACSPLRAHTAPGRALHIAAAAVIAGVAMVPSVPAAPSRQPHSSQPCAAAHAGNILSHQLAGSVPWQPFAHIVPQLTAPSQTALLCIRRCAHDTHQLAGDAVPSNPGGAAPQGRKGRVSAHSSSHS